MCTRRLCSWLPLSQNNMFKNNVSICASAAYTTEMRPKALIRVPMVTAQSPCSATHKLPNIAYIIYLDKYYQNFWQKTVYLNQSGDDWHLQLSK